MADEDVVDEKKATCTFFKKAKRKGNVRKRKANSSESEDETSVVRKEKKSAPNPMKQKTGNTVRSWENVERISKRSISDKQDTDPNDPQGGKVKFSFKSTRSAMSSGPQDSGATSITEIDTELDRDAQAIFERKLAVNKDAKEKGDDDKLYKGINNYQSFYEKRDTAQGNAASGNVRHGPIRAPANIRITTRWDYQADICKDYKETGFCGFGDSCKFLHDRSDYKHGWQLEREVDTGNYDRQDPHQYEVDSDEEDDLPFACFICRESFKNPVVTKCGHYFCEPCALTHYKKSKRCYVCNQATQGVFNPAKDLIKKLKERKQNEEGEQTV